MPNGKTEQRLPAASGKVIGDHDYSLMDTTSGGTKRKNSPITPTKSTAPPLKVKSTKDSSEMVNASLVEAIEKLTSKMDSFGDQLRENSVMVASIAKLVELNATEIKECKIKIQTMEKEVPRLIKENNELKEKVTELERYKRRWNLKIHGLKEKADEKTRDVVMSILSKLAPQWNTSMESVVDSAHRIGRKEEGRDRQIIIQFTMRFHRDAIWKMSKNSKICKDLGIHFKQDFCKADREARAAAWPKMEQARMAGQNVYYRGHVGYINEPTSPAECKNNTVVQYIQQNHTSVKYTEQNQTSWQTLTLISGLINAVLVVAVIGLLKVCACRNKRPVALSQQRHNTYLQPTQVIQQHPDPNQSQHAEEDSSMLSTNIRPVNSAYVALQLPKP